MRETWNAVWALLAICLGVGLCMAVVHLITEDRIALQMQSDAVAQRKAVLSMADRFVEIPVSASAMITGAYQAFKGITPCGIVFTATPKGYGGVIQITVGMNQDGILSGVQIGDNKETPGLGSKAMAPSFLDQFKGKSSEGPLSLVKHPTQTPEEIAAITGATITSKGVFSAVKAARTAFQKIRKPLK
jgi:electron transport complex protein RnfG